MGRFSLELGKEKEHNNNNKKDDEMRFERWLREDCGGGVRTEGHTGQVWGGGAGGHWHSAQGGHDGGSMRGHWGQLQGFSMITGSARRASFSAESYAKRERKKKRWIGMQND